jgi:trans-2,3-dihydro-3-hydroxyanthranilic acid synthase
MPIPTIEPYRMPAPDEVPANTANWTVAPDRAVLLVHDMQRYFVRFFPAGEQPVDALLHNIRRLRRACAERGVPVAYTAQPGAMTDDQRGLLKDIWGPGMSADPEQRDIVDELAPGEADQVFTKWRYSAFFRTGLRDFMLRLGRDQLIVCGVYAHVGCLVTACEAFTQDMQTFLVADAVADFTAEYHRLALRYAAERCAMTPTTETVVGALTRKEFAPR